MRPDLLLRAGIDASALKKGVAEMEGQLNKTKSMIAGVGKMMAGAFAAGAVISAGKQMLDFAGKVSDLSAKLGMTTSAVQKFQAAFAPAGVSIESVAKSAAELANRVMSGDKGALAALQKLGVSAKDLKAMSMEDMFIKAADAVGGLQSTAERIHASKSLFGKGGVDLLAGLNGRLRETTEEFQRLGIIIDQKTIAAADDFGDQMSVLSKIGSAFVANVLGPALPGLAEMAKWLINAARGSIEFAQSLEDKAITAIMKADLWLRRFLLGAAEGSQKVPILGARFGATAETVKALREGVQFADDRLKMFSTSTAHVTDAVTTSTEAMVGFGDAAVTAATKGADAFARLQSEMRNLQGMAWFNQDANEMRRQALRTLESASGGSVSIGAARTPTDLIQARNPLMQQELRQLESSRLQVSLGPGFAANMPKPPGYLATGFNTFTSQMGPTALQAFTGGGDVGKSIGALAGQSFLTKGVGDMAGKAISGTLGKTIGGIVGSVIPGLGTILGGIAGNFLGKGIGKLFGGGEGKKVNDQRDAFFNQFGGSEGLAKQAGMTDDLMKKVFNAKSVKDFETAVKGVETALGEAGKKAADLEAVLAKYNVIWTDFQGPEQTKRFSDALKAVDDDFKALTAAGLTHEAALVKVEDGYLAIAQQALAAGQQIPAALAPALLDLAKMGQLTEDQAAALLGLGATAGPSFDQVKGAAERYKIAIDELGPKIAQLNVADAGKRLEEDFKLMMAAGADTSKVIEGMSDAVNDMIHRALTMGSEVPAGMREMLQKFADQGELTDENGNKLRDLTRIDFAEPIEKSVDRLIIKLQELIDKIGDAGSALGDLPDAPSVPAPPAAPVDGIDGPIPMAGGGSGFVSRPTLFLAGERGSEEYAFSGANRSFGRGGGEAAMVARLMSEVRGLRDDFRSFPNAIAAATMIAKGRGASYIT